MTLFFDEQVHESDCLWCLSILILHGLVITCLDTSEHLGVQLTTPIENQDRPVNDEQAHESTCI